MTQEEFEAKYVNQIICGDCLDVMKDWPDGCVDLVLMDPPYGVGFADWDERRPSDEWFDCICRLSKTAAVHAAQGEIWAWPRPDWVMAWFMPGSINRTRRGNFRHWEPVLIYGEERAVVDSRVFPPIGAERNGHPCPKPDNVVSWLVGCLSETNDIVLDCMCGSGKTCVAAKKLGRRFIGIDISEQYCQIARERLKALETGVPVKEARQGQQALFE